MREKNLVIEDYGPANAKKAKAVLDKLLLTEELDLTVQWRFYERKLDKRLLSALAEVIRERGRKKEFSVNMVIETNQWQRAGKLRKILNQYGFTLELLASPSLKPETVRNLQKKMLLEHVIVTGKDYQTLRKTSDPYWKQGVPVIIRGYNLSLEEYTDWFRQWTEVPKGAWIDVFLDAAGYLYTGTHITDCCHDSCLGKYLYIDSQGNKYFCVNKNAKSYMADTEWDELYEGSYVEVLKRSVEKRRGCKGDCDGFDNCQGGCPLSEERRDCGDYLKKIQYIQNYVLKHSKNLFSDVPNPGLRQLFLSAAGFGFRM